MAATEARREARFHGRALVRTAQTRARQRAARRWPVRPGCGHLRKAQPTKPMQLDHFTLLRRERKERACCFSRGVGALLPARPFERLRDSIIVERSLVAPLAAPEVLALQIQSDRENPRFELTTRLEVQTAAVQMQKRLLDQVIGLFGATQITGHGTLQERSVALE